MSGETDDRVWVIRRVCDFGEDHGGKATVYLVRKRSWHGNRSLARRFDRREVAIACMGEVLAICPEFLDDGLRVVALRPRRVTQ